MAVERVVFVDDVSDSLGSHRWPCVDEPASARFDVSDGVRTSGDGDAGAGVLARERSRLGDGLRAAGAYLGPDPGVVRLRTDGRDTEGDAPAAARTLAALGHRVYVEAPSPAPADVSIDAVRVLEAAPGEPVKVSVSISASVSGRVRVSLFRDGAERAALSVPVSPALPSVVQLIDGASRRTSDGFEVDLVPEEGTPDEDRANDRVRFEVATNVARVVIVGEGSAPPALEDGVRTSRLPTLDEVDFGAIDLLVTSNLPARAFSDDRLERLTRFVASGGSMLVMGGDDAYGPGGVSGSSYERLLALYPRRDDGDGVACVVAFDHSGSTGESMGGESPAIEALRRAVRALDRRLPARTNLFVLPFSDRPGELIPIERRQEGGDVNRSDLRLVRLDAITPAGGTNLPLAIEAAVEAAVRVPDVRRRRVFLLTDGDPDHPSTPAAFAALRARLDRTGVEFAAIVRGDDVAAVALRTLTARQGDVVRIDDASGFPEALVRTFDRGRAPDEITSGPFAPVPADDGLDALAGAAPRPTRLHRLDAAGDAVVWARAPAPDGTILPVAAMRRVGAGRVVSFAGGPALEPADARGALIHSLKPLFARLARAADRGLGAEREGDRLRVENVAGLGSLPLFVGDEAVAAPLLETQNGVYEGLLPPGTPTDAILRAGTPARALHLPFGPGLEHRGAGVDLSTLRAIADAGLGRVLARDEPTPRRRGASRLDLSPYCFGMAVLLLLLDRILDRAPRRLAGAKS